jgi:hypothetical protein
MSAIMQVLHAYQPTLPCATACDYCGHEDRTTACRFCGTSKIPPRECNECGTTSEPLVPGVSGHQCVGCRAAQRAESRREAAWEGE